MTGGGGSVYVFGLITVNYFQETQVPSPPFSFWEVLVSRCFALPPAQLIIFHHFFYPINEPWNANIDTGLIGTSTAKTPRSDSL